MSNGRPGSTNENEEEDELLGRVLDGRFRIEELIGEGGMGRVYRGHQLSVERDVAIKVLHGELSLDEELKKRFFREAKVVSDFTHPNIVRLIDFGSESELGLLYLVMELIRGLGLDELLEHGRLRPELAMRIAYQTAGALVEAHSSGVIHRDLKAENLLLVPVSDGTLQAKVVDFGIAYPQKASEKLTMTGRIYGTASYMAPEQAQGHDVDARADLFSLGVLMFEMLTGQLPIEGTNSIEVMIKQIREGPPRLSAVLPPDQLPAQVFDLVDSLLAGSAEQRPESAREVRERLESLFRQEAWEPVRLDTSADGLARFDPWLLPPIDVDPSEAVSRGGGASQVDSQAPTPRDGAAPASSRSSRERESGGPAPPGGESGVGAEPSSAGDASAPRSAASGSGLEPEDETSSHGGLLTIAIVLGLVLVVLVPVVAFVGISYLRPDVGSPFEAVLSGSNDAGGAVAAESPKKEAAPQPSEDPVCGTIDRPAIPKAWRGGYKPQGGDDERSLSLGSHKLNVRWPDGGGTIWIAKASMKSGEVDVACARYAGAGEGEECAGTIRRRGPVLVVKLSGTEVCEGHFSGAWLSE